jgi:competence protein ComEC
MSQKYSIIRFTIFFISGILFKDYFNFTVTSDFIRNYLIFYIFFLIFYPRRYFSSILSGLIVFFFTFLLGIYYKNIDDNDHEKDLETLEDTKKYCCISMQTKLLDHEYDKCIFTLKTVKNGDKWEEINDFIKVQIFFKDSDELQPYKINYGDIFLISGNLQLIPSPKNPFEFNFKKHLQKEYIYFNDWVFLSNCKLIKNNPLNLFLAFIENCRFHLNKNLLRNIPQDDNIRGILLAMFLGDKSKLTPQVQEAYQKTGIGHILTISGLHCALVFTIIIMFLSLFLRAAKFDILKKIIALILIFYYAAITGMNPPVLRAILAITFITLLSFFNNKTQSIIILFNSALLLIILSPNIFYSASFQMSYSSVLGILLFYKEFYNIYKLPKKPQASFIQKIKIKIFKVVKDTLIVTFSTKLTLSPLMIYYFHSFTLFNFLINLIVITIFTPMILALGFLVIFSSFFNSLSQILSSVLSFVVENMNKIVVLFFKIPYVSYTNIAWDLYDIFLFYSIVCFFYLAIKYKKSIFIYVMIAIGYLWVLKIFNDDLTFINQDFCIEYDVKPFTAKAYIRGNKCLLQHNIPEYKINPIMEYNIRPSLINYKIDDIIFDVKI